MGTLSTHVLDTSRGRPAEGVAVQLFGRASPEPLGDGVTNADGRLGAIGPERLEPGDYRLRFDTGVLRRDGDGRVLPRGGCRVHSRGG